MDDNAQANEIAIQNNSDVPEPSSQEIEVSSNDEPTQESVELPSEEVARYLGDEESNQDNSSDGELPEFAKRRLGQVEKKHQRELREYQRQIQDLAYELEKVRQGVPANQESSPATPLPEYVPDPYTGEKIPTNTYRGQFLYEQQKQQEFEARRAYEVQQREIQKHLQQYEDEFFESLEDASKDYPDYYEVIQNPEATFTKEMIQTAQLAPQGAKLLYYLAKNPKEVQRMARLNPIAQAREMMKHLKDFATKKTVSKAPPPVKPLEGHRADAKPQPGTYEYFAARAKEKARKGYRR